MDKLTINVSPHVFSSLDTGGIMKGVLKALLPAVAASIYFYRWNAFWVIIAAVAGCVVTEYLLQRLRRRKVTVSDMSAVITGTLLALVLPPATPLWMSFLGGVFAVALGKEIFGGLGKNVFNPALLARAFLMAAFPVTMTTWNSPVTLDAITTATPLGLAKFEHVSTPYMHLFLGNVGGCIGETSSLALLAGFAYLLHKKVIDYRIPLAYIFTVVVFSGVAWIVAPDKYLSPMFHIFAGGMLLGAVFMATDPVTSPVTASGRWIFGAGCGVITMIIRFWGGLPEGVMYSILLMNAATPLINRFARPRRFGVVNGGK
jgi:Na+-translocating ferredoxin:NAD+ oxidoreductase subunit D